MRTFSQNQKTSVANSDEAKHPANADPGIFSPLTGGHIFHMLGFGSQSRSHNTSLEVLSAVRKYTALSPKTGDFGSAQVPPATPPPAPKANIATGTPAPKQFKPPNREVIPGPVRSPPPEQYNKKTMTFVWTRLRSDGKQSNRFR